MTQPDVINKLQRALVGGEQHLLEQIPSTLSRVIKQRIWAECTDKQGRSFPTFESFVVHPLWWGLESTIDDLLAFCRKRPEIQALLRAEVGPIRAHGRPEKGTEEKGSITTFDDRGSTYTLRRLKRDNPELAEQVTAGTLTANEAAIQAGFRVKTISVPLDVERAAQALRRHFSGEEFARLIQALQSIQACPKDSKAPAIGRTHAGGSAASGVGRS